MTIVLFYLAVMLAGYLVGAKLRNKEKSFQWVNLMQLAAILLLAFTMGARIGVDDKLIQSLSGIGLTAVLLTVLIMGGSLAALYLLRKFLKFNKEGRKADD